VRAGLDTINAISRLDTATDIELSVRVGIATGVVVAGDIIGEGSSEERAVLGDVPNLASRLQSMASPGTMLVSDHTHDLVRGLFVVRQLDDLRLKGMAGPVTAFEVTGLSDAPSRFDAAAERGLATLVGRKEEIELLRGRWDRARGGESQLVLLSGEPGVGKSRVVRGFLERIEDQIEHRVLQFCSPYYRRSAFRPIIDQLERGMNFRRGDSQEDKLGKLDAMLERLELSPSDHGPPLASLLSISGPSHAPPPDWGPPEVRRHIFASLGAVYAAMARQGATLLVLEDAHWIDPSSEEFIGQLLVHLRPLPLMIVVTHRPEYVAPWAGRTTTLYLDKLTTAECGELVSNLTGSKSIPNEVIAQIVTKSDGVPLFAEELAKTVLDSGVLQDRGDHFEIAGDVSALGVPSSLQDSLTSRLDRLGSSKGVAQLAAVIGRQFEYEILAKLSPLSEPELESALDELLGAGLVYRLPAELEDAYEFKHALIQESAYQSLLRATRRGIHKQIASTMEREYPELASAEPEVLAHHYTEANLPEKAVHYWQRAGQAAIERSANREAESHVRRGLRVLEEMPRSADWQRQYAGLQNALGVALMPTRGFGDKEVGDAFTSAAGASEAIDDRRGLYVALRGLGQYLFISGNVRGASTHVGRVMSLAEELDDWGALLEAHHLAWITQTFAGNYIAARTHAEVGIARYESERDHILTHIYTGHDPGVCCRSFCALPTWQLGYPDQSVQLYRDGEDLAQQLGHPFSIAVSLWAKAMHQIAVRMAGSVELCTEWDTCSWVGQTR
jgi:hypothetical protein